MPIDPWTWSLDPATGQGEFLTATRLDSDLYLWKGLIFTANGIRFHARRPIYKGYCGQASAVNSLASGTWGLTYGNASNSNPASNVSVDTPGLIGAWFDPRLSGSIQLNNLAGGGGMPNVPGGLALGTTYCLWPATANTGNLGCGFGNRATPSTSPSTQGTLQATNSAHQTNTFAIDLFDSNSQQWAPFAFNGSSGALDPVPTNNPDGSGWASRWLAHWVSVYPVNGFTVSATPAPVVNWTSSSALTSALLNGNSGLRDVLRFFNMPPLARAAASSSQALTANTAATVNLTATSGMVTYSSFASNTFTAPFSGLYFVHGYVACQNFNGNLRAGVHIASNTITDYWGPYTPMPGTGEAAATKTQIFSLDAGDTVTLRAYATAAANTSTAHPARLVVVYVGNVGTPSPLPTAPDTSFRWTAGTPGPVATLFNQHIANDLALLNQRPYLMAYQTAAQAITVSTQTSVTMDTVKGIVQGDAGDNYSGWSAVNNNYVAPVSGWYMAVEEIFFAQPTLTATPSVLALLGPSPHGTDVWDRYQQQNMITGSGAGSGATAVSYYYLRAGDTISPGVQTYDSTSTTINTTVTGFNSHFELVYLGE